MDDGRRGQRFCLYHAAAGVAPRGAVLFVHPFAEEMNKSRRMAAMQSRALAAAGHAVLQIDLLGCGDSSGDFGDATWHAWVEDVVEAARWLQRRDAAPLWLWGLRAGCLIAAEAARHLDTRCNFLFWQPPGTGKTLLQQFLRLQLAADLLDGKAKGAMETLRQQLAAGSAVEIAGYNLAPQLAAGLEKATLTPPANGGRVEWMEVSTRTEASISPVSERALTAWRDAGYDVASRVVNGPAFWQTTEIEDAPALIDASVAAVSLAVHAELA